MYSFHSILLKHNFKAAIEELHNRTPLKLLNTNGNSQWTYPLSVELAFGIESGQ